MPRSVAPVLCAALLAFGTACATARPVAAPVFPPFTGGAGSAFSPVVKANGFIFLAGQLGTDGGRLVPGGIGPETRQTMTNIKNLLERNGSSMDKVVRCLVLLADINDRQAMSAEYVTFFAPDKRPVRTAAGSNGLALNAKVEIECVAVE